jgi:hypothetical protein
MSINLGIIASSRTTASAALLLDTYTGAAAAYSLRKLRSAYTGAAIRVRRSSDNTETDIGFVANALDTATLLTFCGVGNGFVTTWYDQSGNSRNIIQSISAYQPRIVASGTVYLFGLKPSLYFSSNALSNSSFTLTQPNTYFIVTQGTSTNSTGDRNIFDGTGANRNAIGKSNGNSNYFIYAGSGPIYSTTSVNNNKSLFVSIFNSTTSFLYLNNTAILSNVNPGTQSLQGLRIGGYTDIQAMWESYIPEFIVYNSNQSTNRAGIQTNINSYYSIY